MYLQIHTVEQFVEVTKEVGLVPLSFGAVLAGVSDRALRDRLERGTLRSWVVNGGVFVSVVECRRRGARGLNLPN